MRRVSYGLRLNRGLQYLQAAAADDDSQQSNRWGLLICSIASQSAKCGDAEIRNWLRQTIGSEFRWQDGHRLQIGISWELSEGFSSAIVLC